MIATFARLWSYGVALVVLSACNPLAPKLTNSKIDNGFTPGLPQNPGDTTPPAAPAISYLSPATSPASDAQPAFAISLQGGGAFLSTDLVQLFAQANCAGTAVASATGSTGTSVSVETGTAQSSGVSVTYSARVTDAAGNATCSSSHAVLASRSIDYVYDSSVPAAPGLSYGSPSASPGTDAKPSFTITLEGGGNFVASDIITLYDQAACAGTSVGSTTGITATSTSIETSTSQSNGVSVTYSAKVTNGLGTSTCSSTHGTTAARSKAYIYDNTAPVVPLVAMASGSSNPDTDSTPSFAITLTGGGNYTNGDIVTLYQGGDNTCSGTARGSSTISGSATASVNITTDNALGSFGATNFFAKVTDLAGNSTCALSALAYTYKPTKPTSVTRQVPTATPGTNTTPTIRVSGGSVANGATVTLYTNSNCTTSVGSVTSSGTTADVTTSTLSAGSYLFYATVTINSTASDCSTAAAAYLLDLTAPAAPSIALLTPASSPATDSTPKFTIALEGGVSFGSADTITLHTGANCSGAALSIDESSTGYSSTSLTMTVASGSAQSEGTSAYRVKVVDEAGNATCSTSHGTPASQGVAYLYDNTAPTWADSVSTASTNASTTDAPAVTYTANAADGASGSGIADYEYSIGTSSGGTQLRSWTTTGGTPFTPSSLTLTIGTTYYLNMRAKDNVGFTSSVITKSWQAVTVPTLSYASSTGKTGTRGTAMSVTPSTLTAGTSATISSCSVSSGTLPTGMNINGTTCVISGTPTTVLASSSLTITVTNSFSQSVNASVTLEVNEVWSDSTNANYGFLGATKVGTAWSTNKIVLAPDTDCDGDMGEGETLYTNCNELDASWTPQWSSLNAYWKMNNNWNDSKNTNHGTEVSSPTFSSGARLGSHAGVFNGSQAVDIPNDVISASGDLTISAWIKTSSAAETSIINNNNSGDGRFSFLATSLSSGMYRLFVFVGNTAGNFALFGSSFTNNNVWHHAVATRASGTWTIYIDGYTDAVGSTSNAIDITKDLLIGNSPWMSAGFSGTMDDVAIWSTALSAEEVKSIYRRQMAKYSGSVISRVFDAGASTTWDSLGWVSTLPFGKELTGDADNSGTITSADSETSTDYSALVGSTGLTTDNDLMSGIVGLWHFNETSYDSGPSGVDVQNFANTSYHGNFSDTNQTFGVPSPFGRGIECEAGRVVLASPIDIGTDWTISGWFLYPFTSSIATWYTLTRGQSADHQIIVQKSTGLLGSYDSLLGSTFNSSGFNTSTLSHGWHHVVARASAGKTRFYMDGVYVGQINFVSTSDIQGLCNFQSSGQGFGTIDELAVWTRALDEAEILQLYRRGANRVVLQVRSCVDETCSTNPVWMGPALVKSGTTTPYQFFSEQQNNTSLDALSYAIGRANVSLPTMLFSGFAGLSLPASRWLQYRAILESDDVGTACSGTWCGPDIKSVSIAP
ncbi:MAG TPA: LamG-like jellyroll fold domain-containing protein [Bdellovibrionota bacterium]|nr:LamG-like jellyroll fold domain-containing protein [Bdellovibrionota bacterium]